MDFNESGMALPVLDAAQFRNGAISDLGDSAGYRRMHRPEVIQTEFAC
jgi:hypothetical protein